MKNGLRVLKLFSDKIGECISITFENKLFHAFDKTGRVHYHNVTLKAEN